MRKIQMVDLKTQYQRLKNEIDEEINKVLESTAFVRGIQIKEFEDELSRYLNVKHVITCGNGTDALQLSLMALGLQPGDEIITPDFTFAATVEVVALLGLKPVLVDVLPDSFNIDPEQVRKKISSRTKAIIPVHLFGQAANMEEIMKIADEYGLYVIEDNAQSIGSDYYFSDGTVKKAGTLGTIGTTSFFPSKNLGAYGDGGAVFTDDDDLAYKIRGLTNHGMYKRYYYDDIGINSRLDTIQAAVLKVKLKHLEEFNFARQRAAEFYDKSLAECRQVSIPFRSSFTSHVFHQYTIRLKNGLRDALAAELKKREIPYGIYYPVPLHKQKAYAGFGYNDTDFKITDQLCSEVISLPMHTELDQEQQNFITDVIIRFLKNNQT